MLSTVLCFAFVSIALVAMSLAIMISCFFFAASRNPVIIEETKNIFLMALAAVELLGLVCFIYLVITIGRI